MENFFLCWLTYCQNNFCTTITSSAMEKRRFSLCSRILVNRILTHRANIRLWRLRVGSGDWFFNGDKFLRSQRKTRYCFKYVVKFNLPDVWFHMHCTQCQRRIKSHEGNHVTDLLGGTYDYVQISDMLVNLQFKLIKIRQYISISGIKLPAKI